MHTPTREECIADFLAALAQALIDYPAPVSQKDDHDHDHDQPQPLAVAG